MDEKKDASLGETIKQLKQWLKFIRSKLLLILCVGILGAILGIVYAKSSGKKYKAVLSFVLTSDSKSGSSLAGLAGQFGIDISGSNAGAFDGDNIVELFKSKKMIKRALFKKMPRSNQTLLDFYIEKEGFLKNWQKDERLKNILPIGDDQSKLIPVQDSLINFVYSVIENKVLKVDKRDKKLSFYDVNAISGNELFSFYLTQYIVDVTSQFYIETKTKNAKTTLTMLKNEADSLENLLGGVISKTASSMDATFSLNPAFLVRRSNVQQGQSRVTALSAAYGEITKNLEIAKISLQKETPIFQVIDSPELPLVAQKPSSLICLIIGAVLFSSLALAFFVAKRIFNR